LNLDKQPYLIFYYSRFIIIKLEGMIPSFYIFNAYILVLGYPSNMRFLFSSFIYFILLITTWLTNSSSTYLNYWIYYYIFNPDSVFLSISFWSRSPTETQSNCRWSHNYNAISLTYEPGGPTINILWHSGRLSLEIRNSIGF